jgi:hypothetical protein
MATRASVAIRGEGLVTLQLILFAEKLFFTKFIVDLGGEIHDVHCAKIFDRHLATLDFGIKFRISKIGFLE